MLEIWGQWSFQSVELRFHGIRNLAYMLAFACLGWTIPKGGWAIALILLLACELLITLWDFVEEDRTRHLPAKERVTHTLLTLNYGVILAMLIPAVGLGQGAKPDHARSLWHHELVLRHCRFWRIRVQPA